MVLYNRTRRMQGYFFEEKNVSQKNDRDLLIEWLCLCSISISWRTSISTPDSLKQVISYTLKSVTAIHFKSGHFRFSAKDVFIALTNFNLHGQSILLVHPYQQESNARKAGNWIFGFSKGLSSCFRLPTQKEMSSRVPNYDPSVCYTEEAQINLPNRSPWE